MERSSSAVSGAALSCSRLGCFDGFVVSLGGRGGCGAWLGHAPLGGRFRFAGLLFEQWLVYRLSHKYEGSGAAIEPRGI
jgi:hypothetical protein